MTKVIFRLTAFLALVGLVACEPQKPEAGSHKNNSSRVTSPLPDYKTARKVFWQSVYTGSVNSLYCGESFDSDRRQGYNIEHVFPMSWVTNGLNCGKRKQCRQRSTVFNKIEADLHNLYPSRVDVNRERSSFRFGVVNGEKRRFGRCDFEVNYRTRVAEPTESARGEVARAMFYMAHQYQDQGLVIFDKQAKLLLKWHRQDPPSKQEVKRNNAIERIQGNRNPFVDDPKLLETLYKQGKLNH